MIKGVTHAHLGPIWYHSEPSGVPHTPNKFLGWDFFFATSYSKMALGIYFGTITANSTCETACGTTLSIDHSVQLLL